jgi:iron complex outermembrane recepter protein
MRSALWLGAVSAVALFVSSASAQQAPPSAKPVQAAQSESIETVVVTARRRSENLEKVPVAVTVLSSDTLRVTDTTSALGLQNLAPSLEVAANLGSRDDDTFTIRGQSQPFGGADPGVQTYFSQVPFNASGPGSEYDLANIQVLNGPQGTLFGRNTTGGAILFEPKRPDYDAFGGYIDVTGGDYDLGEFKGAINVPLGDTLAVRVAADVASRQGFTKDISTGEDLDNVDYQAFRLGVSWKPFNGFENYAVFDYLRDHNNGTGAELTGVNTATIDKLATYELRPQLLTPLGLSYCPAPAQYGFYPAQLGLACGSLAGFEQAMLGALAQQKALGPRETTSSIPLFFRRDSWGVTDIATYDVAPHLHLENIFGFRSDKEQPAFDYDGSDLPILDIANSRTWESDSLQVTEEFQVKGETADNSFNWIAGFYHELSHPGGYSEIERETFGGYQPVPTNPLSAFGTTEYDSLTNGGTSNALYGSMTYDASSWLDGLSFTAGGRYTWDHKVATALSCILPEEGSACPYPIPNMPPYTLPTQSANFHAPTWTLSADYQVTDDTLLYATYRRGYKSGGFNSGAGDAETGYGEFQPEYLTDVELGTKNNWTILGVPGRTNFDVYYGWYDDIQKNDIVDIQYTGPVVEPPDFAALTFNAAQATVKGLEFQSTFIPDDNFKVSVFYSYTDASYSKFVLPDSISISEFTGMQSAESLLNLAGSPFAYTPKNKFGITPQFHIPINESWGLPYLSGTLYWQDKEWFTDLSGIETTCGAFVQPATATGNYPCLAPAGQQPDQKSYMLLNLRFDWDNFLGNPFDLSMFVDNVTNRTYKVGADALLNETGTSASIYGPPRMWGLELRYRFGEDGQGG